MYCYSFVLVNRENQESLDNYKRSICISFSACLGNGVPSPLHWPTPAELVLFNNTLLMKNWEKDPTFTTYTQYLKLRIVFLWFFERIYVWSYGHQSQSIIRSNVFYGVDVMFFFKLLRLQVKNVLLSPKNINSYGFSLQSFEIIVSLKLIEMWTVMFT